VSEPIPQAQTESAGGITGASPQIVPKEERLLCFFELITVAGSLLFILLAIGIFLLWILFGRCSEIYSRLTAVVSVLNDNWKVCLLVLVPLFFRPLRKFLINLKEGPLGMKSGKQLEPDKNPGEGRYGSE
jgi:hypothetical protein